MDSQEKICSSCKESHIQWVDATIHTIGSTPNSWPSRCVRCFILMVMVWAEGVTKIAKAMNEEGEGGAKKARDEFEASIDEAKKRSEQ